MATFTLTQTEPSSSVSAIELSTIQDPVRKSEEGKNFGVEDIRDEAIPPDTAVEVRQEWNSPRINMWRVFATFFSFFVFGMNDGAYGVRYVVCWPFNVLISNRH